MSKDPLPCFLGIAAVVVSPAMRRLMETVQRVARTQAAVLIVGETGSGKEIVARAVHHYSLRSSRPWVDVNCAALPDQLMESELFGHEKGAFSGAETARPGLFELANTGTLFLDEIGELEPRMQVKLLRVLDGVPYYRLGGQRKVTVDTRIVAATNSNLEEGVRTGRFRGDLYHRLNQCQLRVPPLRERREDIIPLAEHFLKQHSAEAFLGEGARDLLLRRHWPGNARELRNAVIAALVCTEGREIQACDFETADLEPRTKARFAGALRLEGLERDAIFEALRKTGGNQQRAADVLGISRRTLSRKLKLYSSEAESESHHGYETVPAV